MSSAHLEAFGSLKNAAETTPTTLSSPTGWSVAETELETALTIVSGFPADVVQLSERLRDKSWCSRNNQRFRAGSFKVDDQRVDRRGR